MNGRTDVIVVITAVIVILGTVAVIVVLTEPGPIFRQYPSEDDWQLPTMTLDELSKYDGVKSSKIMISVFNIVFDVTESEFYKQGSGYSVFAGKDCTVMLAEWKAEDRFANLYNTFYYDKKLQEEQKQGVRDMYEGTYVKKYKKVARIWYKAWEGQDKVAAKKYEEL